MRGGLPRSDFPLPPVEGVEGMSALMRKVGLDFGVEDMADALWLASQMGDLIASNQDTQKHDTTDGGSIGGRKVSSKDADTGDDEDDSADLVSSSLGSNEEDNAQSVEGIPFKTPAAPALRIRMDLARALRSLQRTVPSPGRMRFDETATIEKIADQGIWSPVLKPEPERWLEVALVVEHTAATPLWKETIAELKTLFERQGAFRRVTTWRLLPNEVTGSSSSADSLELYAGWQEGVLLRQRPRAATELLDPVGRRLIVLLSDCTSEAWDSGEILNWLQAWSQKAPTVVVQLLPERLWPQSGLRKGVPVWLRGIEPGQPSDSLTLRHRLPVFEQVAQAMAKDSRQRLKLPVVTLAAEPMKQWAKVVAGIGSAWTVGMQFELKNKQGSLSVLSTDFQRKETLSAQEHVQRFRSTASLVAQQLAGLMSAAPVSPPIVNLIRQTLLPESEPVHVAEVFMSGLIKTRRIIATDGNSFSTEYEFVKDVRALLAKSVSIPEAESVLDTISSYISERLGLNTHGFEALLMIDFEAESTAKEMLFPFARVAAETLRQMGGDYVAIADQLSTRRRITPISTATVPVISAAERIKQFRSTASPLAQKLAEFMSVVPVSKPIIDVICQTLLPASEPVHVEEVLMSDLVVEIKSVDSEDEALSTVEYDFVKGVRTLLSESISTSDTVLALNTVSRYISESLELEAGGFKDLLMADFSSEPSSQRIVLPFARVATDVLRTMGEEYAELSEHIQNEQKFSLPVLESQESNDLSIPPKFDINKSKLSNQVSSARLALLEMPVGTMSIDSPLYIQRPEDDRALQAVADDEGTIIIKGSRQMGASSMLNRLMADAVKRDRRVAFLDFQLFDQLALDNRERFFRQFCTFLTNELELPNRLDEYWDANLPLPKICTNYMGRHLLKGTDEPVVLAMDEVNRVLNTSFRSDFFGMLRGWHNKRAMSKLWRRFSQVLVISTEPYQLIEDLNQSPFNVGQTIRLKCFSTVQVAELNRRHGSPLNLEELDALMQLLAGHPYLVRTALYLISKKEYSSSTLFAEAMSDDGPFGDHLRRHLFRLQNNADLQAGLMDVISNQNCMDEQVVWRLEGAGLVKLRGTRVLPKCQLYADYFKKHLSS